MSKREHLPHIQVRNAQRAISLDVPSLQSFAEIALGLAWRRKRARAEINSTPTIFIFIVSDRRMAQLHEQFCGMAEPTDVLTFQHGEIAISAQTAARQARAFRSTLDRELHLYLVHGLLHLCGYDDRNSRSRAVMHRVQCSLLQLAEKREPARLV